jgi:hypothetical protein
MNKDQKRQKAVTVYMLAKSLINLEDENLSGKALQKIKSIEHKLHTVLFAHKTSRTQMVNRSAKILENASKEIETDSYSPLMVGLHILGDQRELLQGVSGFNMNFDEIDSLCANIVDESNITTAETKECNRLAQKFQEYI